LEVDFFAPIEHQVHLARDDHDEVIGWGPVHPAGRRWGDLLGLRVVHPRRPFAVVVLSRRTLGADRKDPAGNSVRCRGEAEGFESRRVSRISEVALLVASKFGRQQVALERGRQERQITADR
jgi:hypothetical protein